MPAMPDATPDEARYTFAGRRFPDGRPVEIRVAGGRIDSVEPSAATDETGGAERWLLPGFFDLQVNGFAGRAFIDPEVTVADVEAIARAVLRTGVTRFLPTVITNAIETMSRQLAVIADAIEHVPCVRAMCPGVHLEGPFLHPDDGPRGAHPREHIRDPDVDLFDRLAEAAGGRVALLTVAPDRPGAPDLIRHARSRGAVVAIGHHRAQGPALDEAIRAGVRLCTHLGNGADAVLPRHPNYIWEQLGDDRLWASFIADGHHLAPPVLRAMLRAKTVGRSVLVTDAVSAAGMPPGRYRLGGTEVELTDAGRVVLPGTPYLAGSAADMPRVIGCAVRDGGASFIEAVQMATLQPARLIHGAADWACEAGRQADVVEADWFPGTGQLVVHRVAAGPLMMARADADGNAS